jgi:hypothetical protein
MTSTAEQERLPPPDGVVAGEGEPLGGVLAQSGAALFPELVWAHYCWEQLRRHSGASAWERLRRQPDESSSDALAQAYTAKLTEFEAKVGQLEEVYWSTRAPSAVAMTVWYETGNGTASSAEQHTQRKGWFHPRRWLSLLGILEPENIARLHRVSDWVTRDTNDIADLLEDCDLLAIRVREVLRGTTELIALRWIFGVEAHLLGFMERSSGKLDKKSVQKLIESQRRELASIEAFYHRAASKSGRIVYVTGMVIGMLVVAGLGALAGLLLWASGLWTQDRLIILCYGAGATGALVSAISRMGKPEGERFNIDFELGRRLLRRLGFFRPFVGAIFGVALYFLLSSGILQITVTGDAKTSYYALAAFLAGFSERYTTVVFGAAERRLAVAPSESSSTAKGSAATAPAATNGDPSLDG